MLISHVREEDKNTLDHYGYFLEVCIRRYQETGSEEWEKWVNHWKNEYDFLKDRIDHHDYSEDDRKRLECDRRIGFIR